MRRSIIPVLCLAWITLPACSERDPRLPTQLPAPPVPNAPTVPRPDAPPAPEPPVPESAQRMLEAPTWSNASRLDAFARDALARAKEILARVRAGNPDAAQLFADFDQVFVELDTAGGLAALLLEVSPEAPVREVCARHDQAIAAFKAEVWLDRRVYDHLAAADRSRLDPLLQRFAERVLADFRLAGVDRDELTRARLAAIQAEIKKLSQVYSLRLNQDTRTIAVAADKLTEMPKDWLASHPVEDAGKITVSTDYPDYFPVMEYARDDATRRALWETFAARGMPDNGETLRRILVLRREAAELLGKPSWAAYSVQDAMARTPETVSAFIEEVAAAARARSDADIARSLAAKRRHVPDAEAVEVWDRFYYSAIVKEQEASFDSEAVRPYFAYGRVKDGIFAVYGELFGVAFERLPDALGWAPEVETWAMKDARGAELGRFWLDMHPRADKFKHAAMFPIQTGLEGARAQSPWAALVCNFPAPNATDHALMQHDDVVTLFHEFGHLIHHLMARGPTIKLSADNEGDFIEAPSQLLEEWAWRPEILQRFARHVETDAPIPTELVARMALADDFGRGMDLMRQIHLSAFSWFIHVEPPEAIDFEAFTTAMYKRYSPFPRPEVDNLYANFGHLTDYSSNYYTYQWSLAIAKDLYTRFSPNPMDPTVAAEYRDKVLVAGATRDASELIAGFLGRPMNLDAYRAWITSRSTPSEPR